MGTTAIIKDTSEILTLVRQLQIGERQGLSQSRDNYILQKYLDELSSCAETVYQESVADIEESSQGPMSIDMGTAATIQTDNPRNMTYKPLVSRPTLPQPNAHKASQSLSQKSPEEIAVDSIIDRLLEVRGSNPCKPVNLIEKQILYLCTEAQKNFLSQPTLLELEAPMTVRRYFLARSYLNYCLKLTRSFTDIILKYRLAVVSMVNTMAFCNSSRNAGFLPKKTTCS